MNEGKQGEIYGVHRRGNLVGELFGCAGRLEAKGVFDDIINLKLTSGRGLALARRDFPRAPHHVNLADFSALPSLQEKEVFLLGSVLDMGGEGMINLQQGKIWSGRLEDYSFLAGDGEGGDIFDSLALLADIYQLSYSRDHILLDLIIENFELQLRGRGSIFAAEGGWKKLFSGEVPAGGREKIELDFFMDIIKNFWKQDKSERSLLQLRPLVGAGRGLTPAGDDLMVGFLSVLHLIDSRLLETSTDFMLSDFADRTTFVSSLALRAALKGSFSQQVVNFYEKLDTGTERKLFSALRLLESVGSSSGLDILAGIYLGWSLLEAE